MRITGTSTIDVWKPSPEQVAHLEQALASSGEVVSQETILSLAARLDVSPAAVESWITGRIQSSIEKSKSSPRKNQPVAPLAADMEFLEEQEVLDTMVEISSDHDPEYKEGEDFEPASKRRRRGRSSGHRTKEELSVTSMTAGVEVDSSSLPKSRGSRRFSRTGMIRSVALSPVHTRHGGSGKLHARPVEASLPASSPVYQDAMKVIAALQEKVDVLSGTIAGIQQFLIDQAHDLRHELVIVKSDLNYLRSSYQDRDQAKDLDLELPSTEIDMEISARDADEDEDVIALERGENSGKAGNVEIKIEPLQSQHRGSEERKDMEVPAAKI